MIAPPKSTVEFSVGSFLIVYVVGYFFLALVTLELDSRREVVTILLIVIASGLILVGAIKFAFPIPIPELIKYLPRASDIPPIHNSIITDQSTDSDVLYCFSCTEPNKKGAINCVKCNQSFEGLVE